MKNRSIFKKCSAILAMTIISTVLFLPESLFAQGAVIGYVYGKRIDENPKRFPTIESLPSNDQLDHLTHVLAVDVYPKLDGSLYKGNLPNIWDNNNNNNKNIWLESLVSRAHQRGVKVSIVIAEGKTSTGEECNFSDVTADVNKRNNLITNIVDFVNQHNLDGVDINWEYPDDADEWTNCIALLNALKNNQQLSYKRISITLKGDLSPDSYPSLPSSDTTTIPKLIWTAVDAIHLMTYDNEDGGWTTHSHVQKSTDAIDEWAIWGTTDGRNLDKKKLVLGCAFYGWKTDSNGKIIWVCDESANDNCIDPRVSYDPEANPDNPGPPGNPGDSPSSVAAKVKHCYNKGYGGVFFWELGYDFAVTKSNSLLKAIKDVKPYIIGQHTVCLDGSVFTLYNPPSDTIYWTVAEPFSFSSTSAVSSTMVVSSTTVNQSTVYRIMGSDDFVKVYARIGGPSGHVIATRDITPCSVITGPDYVCSTGVYELINNNTATSWSVSSGFSVFPTTGNSTTVTDISFYGVTGVLTAVVNGVTVTRRIKATVPFQPEFDYAYSNFNPSRGEPFFATLANVPSGLSYYWYFDNELYLRNSEPYTDYDHSWPCGEYNFKVEIHGSECFYELSTTFSCFCHGGSYRIYPNPVSGVLHIEIDDASSARMQISSTDIRLYDGRGNLHRQTATKGGKVELNVSNLPKGIYYLHIYDGVNIKPDIRQIIVEH